MEYEIEAEIQSCQRELASLYRNGLKADTKRAADSKSGSSHHGFLGPALVMDENNGFFYNHTQGEKMHKIINNPDFKWDKCKLDTTGYDYKSHISVDKDNPLFYYQTEFIIDELDNQVEYNSLYPASSPLRLPPDSVFEANHDGLYYCMEKWDSMNHSFWDQWCRQEMNANANVSFRNFPGLSDRSNKKYTQWGGNCDGANTFAQNLIWYTHRMSVSGRVTKDESFYIAYIASRPDISNIQDVFMAVGVFVQMGGVYSTMGITKSFRLTMSDTNAAASYMTTSGVTNVDAAIRKFVNAEPTMKGSSVKLQKYIAQTVKQQIDPATKGLFFRPNGCMRRIMQKVFRYERSMYVGSNLGVRNFEQMIDECTASVQMDIMDTPPSIIYENNTVILPSIPAAIPTPFWEPPSPFSHPDAWLNLHLPLVFIPAYSFETLSVLEEAAAIADDD